MEIRTSVFFFMFSRLGVMRDNELVRKIKPCRLSLKTTNPSNTQNLCITNEANEEV